MKTSHPIRTAKPPWLRRKLPSGPDYEKIRSMIDKGQLHTVCQEANCPNQFECFSAHTATFLIMGATCTRNCRFCNIDGGRPGPLDPDEPRRVAGAAARMELRYVVVTSVTRDDLDDGGASHFAATIAALQEQIEGVQIEVLIPDFQGSRNALETVLAARPEVLNHNMETVRRLYDTVRPQAGYDRSLELLARVPRITPHIPAKSGIMLGLGETEAEVRQVIRDVRRTGCRMLTIGQYLQPTAEHLPVVEFIPPEDFDRWRQFALAEGFAKVAAGPFVRSSYHAGSMFRGE
ncbi:lipoyl synthase [Desulfosarcina ovata subsp. sediminis]|uniref:Lipoyl synthase n=1 Tax=Desulfosarcina ovata subsp. sediminis TaxID=885957 RepID=A0A5K7ZU02_9BACT|nr:lipoyl synthase [Desulfosarcina ovata]BBO83678.1 lipoyl synthase [Desulfosarcina ovata subsp. sediminis]